MLHQRVDPKVILVAIVLAFVAAVAYVYVAGNLKLGGEQIIFDPTAEKINLQGAQVQLIKPGGGEVFKQGDQVEISWETRQGESLVPAAFPPNAYSVSIILLEDESELATIASSYSALPSSGLFSPSSSFSWEIPAFIKRDIPSSGENYKVEVCVNYKEWHPYNCEVECPYPGGTHYDIPIGCAESNGAFTIVEQAKVPSSWQAYSNMKYGFEFRYPPEWTLEERSDLVNLFNSPEVKNKERLEGADIKIQFQIKTKDEPKSHSAYMRDMIRGINNTLGIATSLDNFTAVRFGENKFYYTEAGPGVYSLELSPATVLDIMIFKGSPGTSALKEELSIVHTILSGIQVGSQSFSFSEVSVNDRIGAMTITSIIPYWADAPIVFSERNAKITFTGKVTVSGKYIYHDGGISQGKVCLSDLDISSQGKLPKIRSDSRDLWFCFSNDDLARDTFAPRGSSGIAAAVIDNYVINAYPSEGWNEAELVSVVTSTETSVYKDDQVKNLIDNFENVYISRNSDLLFGYFTDPLQEIDKDLESTLRYGKDLDGNPGGPVLFTTNSAGDLVQSYEIISLTKVDDLNYQVKVNENVSVYNNSTGKYEDKTRERIFEITKQDTIWKIDKYYPASYIGKYNGFLAGFDYLE